MKYLILISMIFVACSDKISSKTATVTTTDIPYIVAERYFVKNGYKKEDHPSPTITSQSEFDRLFGMAAVMGGKPTPIDFSKQYVLTVIGEPTSRKVEIIPVSLKQQDGAIVFNYKVIEGEQRAVTIQPMVLLIVDNKYKGEVKLVRN